MKSLDESLCTKRGGGNSSCSASAVLIMNFSQWVPECCMVITKPSK